MADLPQQAIYPEDERLDIEPYLPTGITSALDVGCGRGGFGITLRRLIGEGRRVIGVEAVPEQAAVAREGHGFDEVLDGYFPRALSGRDETFDLISFNDVLEHIFDPWQTLRDTHQYLTPSGRVLAAIPNVQYVPVLLDLVRGRWSYTDDGTLDRTHVRFFTRASMIDLFQSTGYTVETCVGMSSINDKWATDPLAPRRMLKSVVAKGIGTAAYLHFLVIARPTAPSTPSATDPRCP
jgi:2-polyprenyl-3-methyl-5-hydroxy-6-metoxy-1,4-benzoquinol methylase